MARQFGRQFGVSKRRSWVLNEGRISVAGTVAGDAQETVVDVPIEHPGTNEDYSAGSLEGLRVTVCGEPGNTTMLTPPTVYVLLIKQGASVPTINTAAASKQAEDEVWLVGKADFAFQGAMSAGTARPSWLYNAAPKTSRRHEKGDRLIVILVNRDAGTWSNPHSYTWSVEVYHVEG